MILGPCTPQDVKEDKFKQKKWFVPSVETTAPQLADARDVNRGSLAGGGATNFAQNANRMVA